jgi:uncharacterized protein YndB with AHSA1/START domain
MEPLRFEIGLDSPLEETWRAWTDAGAITRWFSPEAHIVARPGGAYELFFDPEDHGHMSTKGCTVTELEPMGRLSFSWKGPDQFAGLMNEPVPLTRVRVIFRGENVGTRLSLEHSGWGEGDDWAEAREWHRRAWEGVIGQLKSLLSPRR